jgi:ribosomal protein L40E
VKEDSYMNNQNRSIVPILIKPIIRFIIGLVILLIIRAVVSSLPMIKDVTIAEEFPLTPLQIAILVVDTIIIVVLLNFGREMGNSLRFTVKRLPEVGTIVNLVVVLIAVSVAYRAYSSIGFLLPDNIHWIYPVVFIILIVIPLCLLIMAIYRNMGELTNLAVKGIETFAEKSSICSNCGARLSANARFCANCGQQVAEEEEIAVDESVKCLECGAAVEKDAKFCKECGARLSNEP